MHVAGQLLAIYTAVSLSFDLFPHMLIVVVSGTGWEQDGCIVCAIWATVGRERRRNKEATHHSGTPRKRKGRVCYTAGRWKEVTCPDLKMTVCILTGILLNTKYWTFMNKSHSVVCLNWLLRLPVSNIIILRCIKWFQTMTRQCCSSLVVKKLMYILAGKWRIFSLQLRKHQLTKETWR